MLASLYINNKHYGHIETTLKEAAEIYRRLVVSNPSEYEPDLIQVLHNLTIHYYNNKRFNEAEMTCKEASEMLRPLAASNPSTYEPYLLQTLNNLAAMYYGAKNHSDFVDVVKEMLEIYRRSGEKGPKYVEALGNLSYYEIILRKYGESEQYGREALAIDSTKHWIATNLAAALLFQGKYAEAEQIYRQYKSEKKETFLSDFKAFSEAGVIPKEYEADVEKIKKMLNEE